MSEDSRYTFWEVWCRTYEGDERWSTKRTPDTWDADMVMAMAEYYTRFGGVGGDAAEILRVEVGCDDGIWDDYTDEEYSKI